MKRDTLAKRERKVRHLAHLIPLINICEEAHRTEIHEETVARARMRVITTTEARRRLSELVSAVRHTRRPIPIGRRSRAEVLLIDFPDHMNAALSDTTNMNAYGGGFEFLKQEPDVYSRADLRRSYV